MGRKLCVLYRIFMDEYYTQNQIRTSKISVHKNKRENICTSRYIGKNMNISTTRQIHDWTCYYLRLGQLEKHNNNRPEQRLKKSRNAKIVDLQVQNKGQNTKMVEYKQMCT